MRAVIEHGLDRGALPVKLCYAGPFFRYERPQAGRYRQLQQVGIEAIGIDDPALDAEVIAVADEGFRSLGLRGFRLEITSWATTPAGRSTGSCCRTTCSGLTSTMRPSSARSSTRCGCWTTNVRTSGR